MPRSRSKKETRIKRKAMCSDKRALRVILAWEAAELNLLEHFGLSVRFMP